MSRQVFSVVVALVVSLGWVGASRAAEKAEAKESHARAIRGTYRLMWRDTADGKKVTPPEIEGLLTFTSDRRNFNVHWTDAAGKHFSFSLISTYRLGDTEYSETVEFGLLNDEIGGKAMSYLTPGETKTSPVTWKGDEATVKLPFDPVTMTIGDGKLVAKGPDFTDHWALVK